METDGEKGSIFPPALQKNRYEARLGVGGHLQDWHDILSDSQIVL